MGERGPAPRREAERRRRNAPARPATKLTQEELNQLPFEIDYEPEPPEIPDEDAATETGWHPIVQNFWDSLQRDPARKWMTSADWTAAQIFCESMSRELRDQFVGTVKDTGEVIMAKKPPTAATLGAFLKFLEHIGITESARLRLSKEVTLFPAPASRADGDKVVDIATARTESVQ